VAGPLSPEKPRVPVPATVVMTRVFAVDAADGACADVDEEEVAGAVPSEFVGLVEGSGRGGAAVARVAALGAAGVGLDQAGGVDAADAVVVGIADVECAVGAAGDAEDVVELRGGGGAAVAREAFDAGASKGGDRGGGDGGHEGEAGDE